MRARNELVAGCCAMALAGALWARGLVEPLRKAYAGRDGLAHVLDAGGHDRAMPREPKQVEVGQFRVSQDGKVAGWTVEERNCCTSYPIATRLVLYRAGQRRVVTTGRMIWDWCFVGAGTQIAVASGPVHGAEDPSLSLYWTSTGKEQADERRDPGDAKREWAGCLKY